MTRTRASATLAFATAFVGTTIASGMVATPIANAAPLDAVRSAVVGIRSGAACGALNYDIDLEGEAQALIGNGLSTSKPGNYNGEFVTRRGQGDPQDEAIDDMIAKSLNSIKNCSYVDFGVGFLRSGETDYVSLALGQGPPAPAEAPIKVDPTPVVVPPTPCPEGSTTPTVPAGQTCTPLSAPKNAISVNFDRGVLNWTATVTNSSNIAGQCTYDASGGVGANLADQNFNIAPNGTTSFSVPAPAAFNSYTITTSCHGDFFGKDVEFGRNVQTVSLAR